MLGSCWLVVAVMTELVMVAPASVMITIGLEGIPVPIVFDRISEALLVVRSAALLAQSSAA